MSIDYSKDSDSGAAWLEVPGALTKVTYEEFVTALIKERGNRSMNLEHMVIGICGEAGEIADAVKKNSIYGKELNRENIVEELGDIEFYIAGLRQMLGISAKEVFQYNVKKLAGRYPTGYTDAAAIARADKQVVNPNDGTTSFIDEAGQPLESTALKVIDVTAESYAAKKKGYMDLFIFQDDDTSTRAWPGWVMNEIPKWAGAGPDPKATHIVRDLDTTVSYHTEEEFNNLYDHLEGI